jgi:hypothetical protein
VQVPWTLNLEHNETNDFFVFFSPFDILLKFDIIKTENVFWKKKIKISKKIQIIAECENVLWYY